MENSSYFKNYQDYVSFNADSYGKSSLFDNELCKLGLNCLEPGQEFNKHAHDAQKRYYIVLEGKGIVTIGEETQEVVPGIVFYVPEKKIHSIKNTGSQRLVVMVGIFPPPHAE